MISPWGSLLASLTLLLTANVPVSAQSATPATEAQEESPSEADAGRDPVPTASLEETLLVEESISSAPTSNTIASKLPIDLDRTPAHVGVVNWILLKEQGATVLGDALENVSGINVQTGAGVFDFFVVRGFDSISSGLVLTDGAPEPESSFYQMYNTEQVEVFKGPAGFLYGSNPLAAAVNLVRKQPTPTPFAAVGFSGGSFDTLEATVDINQPLAGEDLTFRINGLYRESDEYRDSLGSEVTAINPALTWRPSDETSINLNIEVATSDFVPDAGLPLVNGLLPEVPRERSYRSPFDFSEQDIGRFQIDVEHRFSDRFRLRNKSYLRELDWRTNGTLMSGVFPNPFAGGRLTVARTLTSLTDDQSFLGNQLEGVLSWTSGTIEHQLLFGLETSRQRDTYTLDVALLPSLDLLEPVETASEPLFYLPSQHQAGDSTTQVLAPYFVDQMSLSSRWQLFVGARLDHIEFEDDSRSERREDDEVSPLIGAVFSVTPGLTLYTNFASSFAPPSVRVTGERKPEQSEQIEVGLRKSLWNGSGGLSLAVYDLTRDNIAIADPNGFTQQTGDQRSRGLEFELKGELWQDVRATFVYAYTDSELTSFSELVPTGSNPPFVVFDRSGNRSALSPEHLANLWLSRRFGRIDASVGARYVDDQFLAEDNLAAIGSHLTLDVAILYSLPRWLLSLHLDNVTDTDYETRGFGSASAIPARPFGARFGVEVRF
ncbi:MAG: TonB-dependent siderophore receptor [Thermoanaerobaculia bacterium]|nr:TonB-dependent siderophore receptor [Thermoanaerobaculia bacterium]